MLSLVKSFMVNSTYVVARCNTIPFLVNLFELFKVHLYREKLYRVEVSIRGLLELPWVSQLFVRSLNPLSPKSDQYQISPCNINAL